MRKLVQSSIVVLSLSLMLAFLLWLAMEKGKSYLALGLVAVVALSLGILNFAGIISARCKSCGQPLPLIYRRGFGYYSSTCKGCKQHAHTNS